VSSGSVKKQLKKRAEKQGSNGFFFVMNSLDFLHAEI